MPVFALPMTTFGQKNYIPEVFKKNIVDHFQSSDAWLNCQEQKWFNILVINRHFHLQTTFWVWFCLSLSSVSTCTSFLFSQLFPFIFLFPCDNERKVNPKLFSLQGMNYSHFFLAWTGSTQLNILVTFCSDFFWISGALL